MFHTNKGLAEKSASHVLSRSHRKQLLTLCEIAVWMIALLIPACGGFYRYMYYSHFQQGICIITNGEVTSEYHSSQYGESYTTYSARFFYTVVIPGTNGVAAQGYDGPDQSSFYDDMEAENIVNQYPVGATVACWYNPDNPSGALLVFKGYPLGRSWSTFWLAIIAMGLLESLAIAVWHNRVHLILALQERGQLAKGIVTKHEQYRSKYGTCTISIISYKAIGSDGSQVTYTIQGPGYLSKKSRVAVCYDPYRPQKALRGGYPTRASLVGWIILALFLLVSISIGASLITSMAA